MADGDAGGAGRLGAVDRPGLSAGVSVEIERHGAVVHLKLGCGDDYGAIALYEELVRSCKAGRLHLALGTP